MLAGELQLAIKSGFRGHIEHGGVLPGLGARIAAEREGISRPEEEGDRGSDEASDIFATSWEVLAEGFVRGMRLGQRGFPPRKWSFMPASPGWAALLPIDSGSRDR